MVTVIAGLPSVSLVYDAIAIKICNRADTLSFIRVSPSSRGRETRLTSRLYPTTLNILHEARDVGKDIARVENSCRLASCNFDLLNRRYITLA